MAEPDSGKLVIAGNGQIFVAPEGTTCPTDIDETLDAAFADIGFTTEEGVTLTDGRTINDTKPWQSFYAIRRTTTDKIFTAAFTMLEWHTASFVLAYGGGVVEDTANGWIFHPPSPEDINLPAMVIDFQDDVRNFRVVLPRGMVTENVETVLSRQDAAGLPVTFSATPLSTASDAWYPLGSDTAAFPATGS